MRVPPNEALQADITLNYRRFKEEPQDRNARGHLTDVLAKLFEQRMNTALEEYGAMCNFTGGVALELAKRAA
jgi:hypothetical protein